MKLRTVVFPLRMSEREGHWTHTHTYRGTHTWTLIQNWLHWELTWRIGWLLIGHADWNWSTCCHLAHFIQFTANCFCMKRISQVKQNKSLRKIPECFLICFCILCESILTMSMQIKAVSFICSSEVFYFFIEVSFTISLSSTKIKYLMCIYYAKVSFAEKI